MIFQLIYFVSFEHEVLSSRIFFFFLYQKSLHSVRCLKKMRNLDLLEQRQAKNCVDYF